MFIGPENFSRTCRHDNRERGAQWTWPRPVPGKLGSMPVNLIRSDSLYPGVPYAYAATSAPGSLIFTAGACPLDDNGQVVGVGDVRAQASLALANLRTALAAAGATLADVLKTTVFVASAQQADLVAAWEVIEAAFGDHDAPSTLLGVTVLGYRDQLVEIEAVAAVTG
jgi:enamine deaminase RidA (YjgF/YER057c/UK114 family)